MSDPIQACAELVARGDPDRFRATMAAPLDARRKLFPLYAFNLEVARAPWASTEPMISEMRLQFWRDVIEEAATGKTPRAHEVAAPFATLIQNENLPAATLDALVAARRWDIYKDPHDTQAGLDAYLDATGGGLMWCAALALGASPEHEAPIRAFGQAGALAALLLAVPDLEARGRFPLADGRPDTVRTLAQAAVRTIDATRAARLPRALAPALWAAASARKILANAAKNPARITQGTLAPTEFSKALAVFRLSLLGRY